MFSSEQKIYYLGTIKLIRNLDYEHLQHIQFTVVATDNGNPVPLNGNCSVEIEVLDVNDNSPQFSKRIYTGTIMENSPLGTKIMHIEAKDVDMEHFGRVSYILKPDDEAIDYLSITDDGWIIVAQDIDYEKVIIVKR